MRLITLIVIQLVFYFLTYGCKTTEPEILQADLKSPNEQDIILNKGFGAVPFHERGKLSFLSNEALKKMKIRKEKEKKSLQKEKEEFSILAKEQLGDSAFNYWIAPPKNPDVIPALKRFPKDAFGYPDWVAAVKRGIIRPKDSLPNTNKEEEEEEVFNQDIIFEINDRIMANVRFPHSVHTYWLSCKICHPGIFIAKKGANDIAMTKIWDGQFCGRCHGAVAYPPKGFENCIRCHSMKRKKVFMNY